VVHLQNSLYNMGMNATCKYAPHLPLYHISIGWLIWKYSPQNTRLGSWGYELIEVFVELHTMYIGYVILLFFYLLSINMLGDGVIVGSAVKGCYKAF